MNTPPSSASTRSRRPPKTATLIAQDILNEITDRNLGAGAVLPPEREMLEQFGVARGTLRESLRFLELVGVLSIKPGPKGGPVVNAANGRQLASTLAILLQLSRASFRTILEVRDVLEPSIARLAAERGPESTIAAISRSVDDMRGGLDDLDFFLAENNRFHELIAKAAGNELFELLIGSISSLLDGTALGVKYPVAQRRAVADEHEEIASAIAAHDLDRAEAAMHHHIAEFRRYLEKNYRAATTMALRWEHARA
jgi:DNA-binding FadR family transcriptional regulator